MDILQIETINVCNAKCDFCPVMKIKERRAPMDMPLFRSIIDQAHEVKPKEIMPFLNGEPLLDSLLVERIAYINDKMPGTPVTFYSNGALLTEKWINALSSVNISRINFSINAVSDSGRRASMGLGLEETIGNIERLHNRCGNISISVSAIMDTTYLTPDQMLEFMEFWRAKGVTPTLFHNGNWAGKTRKTCNTGGSCGRPETTMTILADGTVALCCYDLLGEVSFGNVKSSSLKEIWECEGLEEYRFKNLAGRRGELKLCKDCTTG